MINEIWKPINNYENLYEVSNYGNIKSLPKSKGWAKFEGKILKKRIDKYGYYTITLFKNGKQKKFLVHRLVATAFILNPNNLPQINHKDENKLNNRADNLEWCTGIYNLNYGNRNKKISKSLSKAIVKLDKNGKLIKEYNSINEASKLLKLNVTHISECCRNVKYHKTHGGYMWKYKEDYYGNK